MRPLMRYLALASQFGLSRLILLTLGLAGASTVALAQTQQLTAL